MGVVGSLSRWLGWWSAGILFASPVTCSWLAGHVDDDDNVSVSVLFGACAYIYISGCSSFQESGVAGLGWARYSRYSSYGSRIMTA